MSVDTTVFSFNTADDASKKGIAVGQHQSPFSQGAAAGLLALLGGDSEPLLGEGGKPVRLPANLMADSKAKFGLNQFDVVVSDLISVNRSLADVRYSS